MPDPLPVRETVCGLPGSSSETERTAVRVPLSLGVKVILAVQLAPGASVLPQVISPLKSLKFAPPKVIRLIFRTAPPVLLSVTTCAGVVVPIGSAGKVKDPGEKVSTGPAGFTPVPARLTDCGLLGSLSLITSDALRFPAAPALNVTSIVQELPGEIAVPLRQVELPATAKSPGFGPPIAGVAVRLADTVDLF